MLPVQPGMMDLNDGWHSPLARHHVLIRGTARDGKIAASYEGEATAIVACQSISHLQ